MARAQQCPILQVRKEFMMRRCSKPLVIRDLEEFDALISLLREEEDRHRFFQSVAPWGDMQGLRKILSYDGAIRLSRTGIRCPDDSHRDPGNYWYGVMLRSVALAGSRFSWHNQQYANEYNDETCGDIVEAILGIAWRKRHNLETPGITFDYDRLEKFVLLIEAAIIYTERVVDHATRLGIWESSKTLAVRLL